jgi:hypothetical protein
VAATRATRESAPDRLKEPVSSGPVPLSDEYRRAVEKVELLTQNRPGVDKSWVEQFLQEYRAHYSRASRAR